MKQSLFLGSYKFLDIQFDGIFGKLIYVRPLLINKTNLREVTLKLKNLFKIENNRIIGIELYDNYAYIAFENLLNSNTLCNFNKLQFDKTPLRIGLSQKELLLFDTYFFEDDKLEKYFVSHPYDTNFNKKKMATLYCNNPSVIQVFNKNLSYNICNMCNKENADVYINCECDMPSICIFCLLNNNKNICPICVHKFDVETIKKIIVTNKIII